MTALLSVVVALNFALAIYLAVTKQRLAIVPARRVARSPLMCAMKALHNLDRARSRSGAAQRGDGFAMSAVVVRAMAREMTSEERAMLERGYPGLMGAIEAADREEAAAHTTQTH